MNTEKKEEAVTSGNFNISENKTTPDITSELTTILLQAWQPAEPGMPGVELKTSMDLLEEMAAIADVEKREIAVAMKQAGFKIAYIDGGFYWVMKKK